MSFETVVATLLKNWPYFFITALVLFFWIKFAFLWYKTYERKLRLQKIDLLNHDLFNKLDYSMKYEIQNLKTWDEKKDNVARDFLLIKFYVWLEDLKFFVKDNIKVIEKWEPEELRKVINNQFSNSIVKYETIARKINIPEIFIEKFNIWHSERVELTKQFIWIVLNSPYYTGVLNIQIIFDNYIKEFSWTIDDARHTIKDINGQLKEVKYDRQLFNCSDVKIAYDKYSIWVL